MNVSRNRKWEGASYCPLGNAQHGKRRATEKRGFLAIALLLCCSLALVGCKEKIKPGAAEVKRPEIEGVKVMEVAPTQVDEYYETSATVKAKTTSAVSSRVMGTVTSLKVKEGERVRAGQVLLTIDDRDAAQRVMAAEAGHREAMKALEASKQNKSLTDITFQRYKKLHDERALSQQELDQIETQKRIADLEHERIQETVNRAKAGLSEAQVYRGFAKVTAPISGVVTEKKIEQGSMAVPGTPMITIEDTSSLRIEANVDEKLSGRLKPGMPVDVVIDSIGLKTKGAITEIVPAVDPASRTFLVKISVGGGLTSGLYAKVKIPTGKRETVVLPKTALVEKGQLTGVYTVNDRGLITYRLVRVGKEYDGGIEILSGISPKDRVIAEGVDHAVDGGMIKKNDKTVSSDQAEQTLCGGR